LEYAIVRSVRQCALEVLACGAHSAGIPFDSGKRPKSLRPQGRQHRGRDGSLGTRAGGSHVANAQQRRGATRQPPRKLVRPTVRRQAARRLEQLCRCILGTAKRRLTRTPLDLCCYRLVRLRRARGDVARPLLRICNEPGQAPMELEAPAGQGRSVDDGGEQRMREADAFPFRDDDACLLGLAERGAAVEVGSKGFDDRRRDGA
jgi:hypothetical protein